MNIVFLQASSLTIPPDISAEILRFRLREYLAKKNLVFEETWTAETTTLIIKSKHARTSHPVKH